MILGGNMNVKINEKRLLDTFLKLVVIDSESWNEGAIQKHLAEELKQLGCSVWVDKIGKKIGSNAQGNIIATLKGSRGGKAFLLSSHMDTVKPGKGIKPQVKNNRITSDGTTILGADDKAGLAIILEVLRTLKEQKPEHCPVQVIFTLNEENGMSGAKNLDYSKIKGTDGLILDNESVNELLIQGPEVNDFKVSIKGVAAHAGVCPEKGISALEVAVKALSLMKTGRIDKETVCNFGVVHGGEVTNVVMPYLELKAEVRSLCPKKLAKQVKHMKDCFAKAAKAFTKRVDGKVIKPQITIETPCRYGSLNVPKNAPAVKLVLAAAKKNGVNLKTMASGGGCDANVMCQHGLLMPNLGLGVQKCHTTQEYLDIKEFNQAAAIVLDTVLAYGK